MTISELLESLFPGGRDAIEEIVSALAYLHGENAPDDQDPRFVDSWEQYVQENEEPDLEDAIDAWQIARTTAIIRIDTSAEVQIAEFEGIAREAQAKKALARAVQAE
jgi:hypothetical protein